MLLLLDEQPRRPNAPVFTAVPASRLAGLPNRRGVAGAISAKSHVRVGIPMEAPATDAFGVTGLEGVCLWVRGWGGGPLGDRATARRKAPPPPPGMALLTWRRGPGCHFRRCCRTLGCHFGQTGGGPGGRLPLGRRRRWRGDGALPTRRRSMGPLAIRVACQKPGGACAARLGPGKAGPAICGPSSPGSGMGRQRVARSLFLPRFGPAR